MKAAFIIRLHYADNDPRFEWRFAYFSSMVLPRLLAQSEQDFDIAIWCNPWHQRQLLALSDRIRVFGVRPEVDGFIRPEDQARAGRFHIDFTYWRDVVGLAPYELQIGLDSDDLVHEHYFARIMREVRARPTGSLHVGFQPLLFNLPNLTQYDYKARYGPQHGSPFFAILQRDLSKFYFAYEYSHLRLPAFFDESITVPEGYCWFSIHGQNASTHLPPSSEPLLNATDALVRV